MVLYPSFPSTASQSSFVLTIHFMSLSRIPILLAGALSIWTALTPPHASSPAERLSPTLIGRFAVSFVTFMKIAHVLSCLCEITLITSYRCSDTPLAQYISLRLLSNSSCAAGIIITPTFLVGSILALAGAQLRFACYRALGSLFTFEMSIRKGHVLITTGPYAYVRHPAYTGLIMTMLGEAIIQWGAGSWLRECGWMELAVTKAYLILLIVLILLISFSATRRGWNEDKILKERFGDAWVKWAKETPYKMIPSVY